MDYKTRDIAGVEEIIDTECFGGWVMPDVMHGADIDQQGQVVFNQGRKDTLKAAMKDVISSYKAYAAEQATYDAYSERKSVWAPGTVSYGDANAEGREDHERGGGDGKVNSIESILRNNPHGFQFGRSDDEQCSTMFKDLKGCIFPDADESRINPHYYPSESYRNLFASDPDLGYPERPWAPGPQGSGGRAVDELKIEQAF